MNVIDTLRTSFLAAPHVDLDYTPNFEPIHKEWVPTLSPLLNKMLEAHHVNKGYVKTDSPFFDAEKDTIGMLDPDAFPSMLAYTHAVAHELTHWTGYFKRLGRGVDGGIPTWKYPLEEMTADLGAALILDAEGLFPERRDVIAGYIHGFALQAFLKRPNMDVEFMMMLGFPVNTAPPEKAFDKAAKDALESFNYLTAKL